MPCEAIAQRFQISGQTGFAGVVNRRSHASPVASYGADADDLSLSGPLKTQGGLVEPGDSSQQIDLNHFVIFFKIVLIEGDAGLYARVVDNHIQPTKRLHDGLEEGGDFVIVGDVVTVREDGVGRNGRIHRVAQFLQFCFTSGHGCHAVAIVRQLPHQRCPNARRGPNDNGALLRF